MQRPGGLPAALLVASALWAAHAVAAAPTSIALTMTRPADGAPQQNLAENLLTLVELAVQAEGGLTIVERRQIDLALQELVLDGSRPADAQLKLGKLITADNLAMLELLPPDKGDKTPWGRLRVVDPRSGVIRGVTVAALDEGALEERAKQFARFVSAIARSPNRPVVTVAVLPFESKGRFDRLRPLELGIRDLVAERLLVLSGAAAKTTIGAAGGGLPAKPPPRASPATAMSSVEKPRFQVVQRSSMEQLLRELALIQSGLSDKSRLPEKLPSRAAAYLIRGEIDERQQDGVYRVIVAGEMVRVDRQEVVKAFHLDCRPQDLETELSSAIDGIVARLLADESLGALLKVPDHLEVESLRDAVLGDLKRFERVNCRGERQWFRTTRMRYFGLNSRAISSDSPLGRYVLKKSIDRLESVLYIRPDDAWAAYALAYCCSMHPAEVYRPDRADELCRQVYRLDPKSLTASLALNLLAEIAYHEQTGDLDPADETVAAERLWYALENMPLEYQDSGWAQLLQRLWKMQDRTERVEELAGVVTRAAPYAEIKNSAGHPEMQEEAHKILVEQIGWMTGELIRLADKQPPLREQGLRLLEGWSQSADPVLATAGRVGLAKWHNVHGDKRLAAAAYEEAAAKMPEPKTRAERQARDQQLVRAAFAYRTSGQVQKGLDLLLSIEQSVTADALAEAREVPDRPGHLVTGELGFEIGMCHEALGKPDKARETYLHTLELCPMVTGYGNLLQRLAALGGVPLREGRDVDVVYFTKSKLGWYPKMCLAAAGTTIFVGGETGLEAWDIASEKWIAVDFRPTKVTCLAGNERWLWAGTAVDGLWRRATAGGPWERVAAEKLPATQIESIALDGNDAYAGVGTTAAGGLVRLADGGAVMVFDGLQAPATAPTRIVVAEREILASTNAGVFRFDRREKTWSRLPMVGTHAAILASQTRLWKTAWLRELEPYGPAAAGRWNQTWFNPRKNTGYVVPAGRAGYDVHFVTERGGEIWFGGDAIILGRDSGLYRLNPKTGDFYSFGWSDGFRPLFHQRAYDGLWLDDQLWLATAAGLCRVTPRNRP
ncbi:MAG TPA: hypothetical protein VMF30_10230 [Pirellulales bacterium]|nr:hypothetical protein [Pirellulales bacterium]